MLGGREVEGGQGGGGRDVPGTKSHTVMPLCPWALAATHWYSPASSLLTPVTCREESDRSLTLPERPPMVRPARSQVKLWRTEPSA